MPVSELHQKLVLEIAKYIQEKYADSKCQILMDHNDEVSSERPPAIEGFLPDVFARVIDPNILIIGEAKRVSDIEGSLHTRRQLGRAGLRKKSASKSRRKSTV